MSSRRFFRRQRSDVELKEEIELYLAEEIAENVERGMAADEARRQAYLKFGSPRRVHEEVWRYNSFSMVESFWRDMCHVLQRLERSPSVVLTVMVSLGLGIAANVFVFTAVNRLVLQAPPVGHPETLLDLHPMYDHGQRLGEVSPSTFDDLREHTKSFSGVAAYNDYVPAAMGGGGDPVRIWGQTTTTNFFEVAELPMALGRGFYSDENRSPLVVLSYSLWRRHFLADPAIIGKSISLSEKKFTVIGVMAPGFHGMNRLLNVDFWVPDGEWQQLAGDVANNKSAHDLALRVIIARRKTSVTPVQAQAELDAMAQRLRVADPKDYEGLTFRIRQTGALPPEMKTGIALFLTVLTVVSLLVLCIAGSNVTNLLLARAATRHGEMAVRTALGATRFQLIRPMLLESTLLALCGGVFGVALCMVGLLGLTSFHLPVPIPIDLSLQVDWRVVLYAFLLSLGTGILCGVGPAIVGSRPVLQNSLKGESALTRPGRKWTLRNLLVVLQISLCLVLLCMTGLFLRSLDKSAGVDPGIRRSGVLIMSIDPIHNGYSAEQTLLLLKRLRTRAGELPGVQSAAWTDKVPLSLYGQQREFHLTGRKIDTGHDLRADMYQVSADYFDTIGIPLISGRDLNTVDPKAPRQALVNQAFASRFFGTSDAIGQSVSSEDTRYDIVGVVKNSKSQTIGEVDQPILYRSLEQNIGLAAPPVGFSLLVHFQGNPAQMAAALRNEIHSVDPSLAVFSDTTIEDHLSDALLLPRVSGTLFGIFGIAGLLLAAVGLYGVMSYSVSSRTREIGIRLAMGATHGSVLRLIVRQGMLLSCIALGIGLPLAFGASKVASGVLYGISSHDRMTFTTVPLFLAAVTLLACWIPARRATTVEPQTALRHE
jgi:predicted permease